MVVRKSYHWQQQETVDTDIQGAIEGNSDVESWGDSEIIPNV